MRPPRRHPVACLILAALLLAPSVRAQLAGTLHVPPSLPVHVPATLPPVATIQARVTAPRIDDLLHAAQAAARPAQIQALLRDPARRVALDPAGNPVLRGEYLASGLTDSQVAALERSGFRVTRADAGDDSLGLALAVVRDTRGRSEADALDALQRAAPGVRFTYQHLYLPAGDVD
ncbi:MAG: peptidase S8, partial [Xanthomonadaceae bacterium]|nr:peptidase S8 [Xanthomonadaceae bacterium]